MWFSLPFCRPDPKFDTLFQTRLGTASVCIEFHHLGTLFGLENRGRFMGRVSNRGKVDTTSFKCPRGTPRYSRVPLLVWLLIKFTLQWPFAVSNTLTESDKGRLGGRGFTPLYEPDRYVHPKGYGFWNRVSILTTLVWNRVRFVRSGLELGMVFTRSDFFKLWYLLLRSVLWLISEIWSSSQMSTQTKVVPGQVWNREPNFGSGLRWGRENHAFWSEIG